MDYTLSLPDIFSTLKKRLKLIILITLAAVLISTVISYFILTPVYQASTQILVNQKNTENRIDYTLLQGNVDLISTYSDIIKSPAILEKSIKKLNLKQSPDELHQKISVTSQEKSQVFTLIVEDTSAAEAVKIANTVSETFQEEVQKIMNVNNVSILAKAALKKGAVPVKPKPLFNLALAIVIGLMAGIGVSLLLEFFDNTLKDDEDAAACLGLPILGSIQEMSSADKKGGNRIAKKKRGRESIVS